MKIKIEVRDIFWWFWTITLIFIIAAVVGWTPGYYIVMGISAVQLIVFLLREKDPLAFPVQIRMMFFALTLVGLWETGRLVIFVLLLLGTLMVVLFGRCSISLLLKQMPWNRNRSPRLV